MLPKQKTASVTSIDTIGIATCIANMLYDYLTAEQQSVKVEYIDNDKAQNSEPPFIKTGICLFKTINNGTGEVQSGEY
ncbi:hypothetical protein [Wolbachia endosymbiont (group B) of Horisme vitalbata]|uniref:hypothetical protein n=1 Tax=Wolbachia endosymbiont (group B) of Horisme vitalbata TaxID=3066178 RepID=UPI003341DE35